MSLKTSIKVRLKLTGSEEELSDILQAYRDNNGSLERIFAAVPCANIFTDEERFVEVIDRALDEGDLDITRAWSKIHTTKGRGMRKQLKAKAREEAAEAEQYAKELGVWDQLFGKGKGGKGEKNQEKGQDKGVKSRDTEHATDDDLDGLRAAMAAKASKRAGAFDDMIGRLEAKHTGKRQRR